MQGRRTFLIAALVALVAACSSAGISVLQRHADEQQHRYETLIDLAADAYRVDALESEANAERRVPLAVQSEVKALLGDMHAELADLDARGTDVSPVIDHFELYRPLLTEEFALMRARDFARADMVDQRIEFEDIRHGLRRAAT